MGVPRELRKQKCAVLKNDMWMTGIEHKTFNREYQSYMKKMSYLYKKDRRKRRMSLQEIEDCLSKGV